MAQTGNAITTIPPIAAPTPIPAFAPVLRRVASPLAWDEAGEMDMVVECVTVDDVVMLGEVVVKIDDDRDEVEGDEVAEMTLDIVRRA